MLDFSYKSSVENMDNDITIDKQEVKIMKSSFFVEKMNDHKLKSFLQNVTSEYLRLVPYSGGQTNYLGVFDTQEESTINSCLVTLSHFLPTRLIGDLKKRNGVEHGWRLCYVMAFIF